MAYSFVSNIFSILYLWAFLFLAVPVSFSQTKMIPYQQLPTSSGAPTGSGIYFGASMNNSSITVTFAGPSDRWIALGFGSAMPLTDALIYSNGHAIFPHALGWNDYYINNYNTSGVVYDLVQNWNVQSNLVSLGQRTVVASRALNTGDANDLVLSFASPSLNLVWARGATADYTLAYHGSTNRANNISRLWLSSPTASFISSSTTVCAGSSIQFTNVSTGGQTSYTWTFNSGLPFSSTLTNPAVTFTVPGTYSVQLIATNAAGSNTLTLPNYITVTPSVSPTASISLISGSNPSCFGTPVTFGVFTGNAGLAPVYQWRVNGSPVGANSSSFTSSSLPNSALVSCFLTSNAVCVSPATVSSLPLTMTINSIAPATVTVSLISGSNPLCAGSPATFSALAGNGGNSPGYQWFINGSPVGTNSSTFATSSFINGNTVTCQLSSNAPCASSTIGLSAPLTVTVSAVLIPSLSIFLTSGNDTTCTGSPLSFSAMGINGGSSPTFQWFINGLNTGTTGAVFSSSILSNGAQIHCLMVSNSPCASPTTALSGTVSLLVFATPPAPTITPSGSVLVCSGDSVLLSSSATTGNLWSNGSNAAALFVSTAGSYTVSQTINNCTSPPSNPVQVGLLPLPQVSFLSPDPVCADDGAKLLSGNPTGGIFSGFAITTNSFFPATAGPGTFQASYHYTDTNLCSDTALNVLTVLECTQLADYAEKDQKFAVFPNPGKGKFGITSFSELIETIIVTDIQGRVLASFETEEKSYTSIDLQKLASGYYYVGIRTAQGLCWKVLVISE